MDYIQTSAVDKMGKFLDKGLDPNFQDADTGGKDQVQEDMGFNLSIGVPRIDHNKTNLHPYAVYVMYVVMFPQIVFHSWRIRHLKLHVIQCFYVNTRKHIQKIINTLYKVLNI